MSRAPKCGSCGSRKGEHVTRYPDPLTADATIVESRCKGCGIVLTRASVRP